jgi:hypothetical protein
VRSGWAMVSGSSDIEDIGTGSSTDEGSDLMVAVVAELGQPQTCCWPVLDEFMFEYCGSIRLSRVARQLRMVNGESIEISKWRLFLPSGSSWSRRDIRITI